MIPAHEHTHSLYVHCLDCKTFGINSPTPFEQAAECGNCKSMHTVKYYPSCCIVEAIDELKRELEDARQRAIYHYDLYRSKSDQVIRFANRNEILLSALEQAEKALKEANEDFLLNCEVPDHTHNPYQVALATIAQAKEGNK